MVSDLNSARAIVIACFVFAGLVTLPEQTLELYRYLAQAAARSFYTGLIHPEGYWDVFVLALSVSVLSAIFFDLATIVWRQRNLDHYGELPPGRPRILSILAAIPAASVAIGFARAAVDPSAPGFVSALSSGARGSFENDSGSETALVEAMVKFSVSAELQVNKWLYLGALCFIVLSLGLLGSACLRRVKEHSDNAMNRLIVVGLIMPVILSLSFVSFPIGIAASLTSFGIIALFFITAALFLTAVTLLELKTNLPLMLACFAAPFLFSFMNDNHSIRTLSHPPEIAGSPYSTKNAFASWLKHRKDLSQYSEYPVYIVAAEGGGIYAAFKTAALLATLQDLCPRFSHHLFAISGVSGGSVGAAVFGGVVNKIARDEGRFRSGAGCMRQPDPKSIHLSCTRFC